MGWCTTIASIAAASGDLYGYIARKVESLCKEVEALASKPAAVSAGLSATADSDHRCPCLHIERGTESIQARDQARYDSRAQ